MKLLLIMAVFVGVLIVPIKIAAHSVGAQHKSVFSCVMAIVASLVAAMVAKWFLPFGPGALDLLAALVVAGLVYMAALGTTYFKGIIIASVQLIVTLLLTFLITILGGGSIHISF